MFIWHWDTILNCRILYTVNWYFVCWVMNLMNLSSRDKFGQSWGENGKYRSHYKSKKRIDFEMGPSVKFVSPNKGLISKKKIV